ncbi:hypothetical protein WJX77_003234 [Trebouxia sp. C0004]
MSLSTSLIAFRGEICLGQDQEEGTYRKQTQRDKTIARMYTTHPGDRHYIRLLLGHVTGAKGYEGLRNHEGTLYPTFRGAAAARGLLDDDAMHQKIMSDAASSQTPRQLRHTFVLFLIWHFSWSLPRSGMSLLTTLQQTLLHAIMPSRFQQESAALSG